MKAAYLVNASIFPDELGSISVLNVPEILKVPRVFSIRVNEDTIRGNHAHKECWQVIFAMTHTIDLFANFGRTRSEYKLLPLSSALIVPPMNWLKLECPKDSIITVLTSEIFSESDYLRSFEEYIKTFDEIEISRQGEIKS